MRIAFVLCTVLAGCAITSKASVADVEKAYAAKDAARLDALCKGSAQAADAARVKACERQRWLAEDAQMDETLANGDVGSLSEICAKKEGRHRDKACAARTAALKDAWDKGRAACETVLQAYHDLSGADPMGDAEVERLRADAYLVAGAKLGECAAWDPLFGELLVAPAAAGGARPGADLLVKLAGGGVDVEAALATYFAAHPSDLFTFAEGDTAVSLIVDWLLASGRKDKKASCAAYVPVAKTATPAQAVLWLPYLADVGCGEAVGLATDALKAETPAARLKGCEALGKVGGKKQVAAAQAVANGDAAVEEKDGKQVYPVREACAAAVPKMKGRK